MWCREGPRPTGIQVHSPALVQAHMGLCGETLVPMGNEPGAHPQLLTRCFAVWLGTGCDGPPCKGPLPRASAPMGT